MTKKKTRKLRALVLNDLPSANIRERIRLIKARRSRARKLGLK